MESIVGWLDFSSEHQQSVLESIKAFESKDTVDDLGFGTIRDAISSALFPGTSVLQTRARYFLFIPWIFQEAQKKSPLNVIERARKFELQLISALEESDDTSGVIGIQKKSALKTVPSSIYWSGLQKFGIFKLQGRSIRQFGKLVAKHREDIDYEGEFVGGGSPFWCEMPNPPDGFENFKFAELRLSRDESAWLCTRILSTATFEHPNLLASLVKLLMKGEEIVVGDKPAQVWDLVLGDEVDDRIRDLVHHTQYFSMLVQGTSLIYNSMVVERLRSYKQEIPFSEDYEDRLLTWLRESSRLKLDVWCRDVDKFWSCLKSLQIDTKPSVHLFVTSLCKHVSEFGLDGFIRNQEVRELIEIRESTHKKHMARLRNKDRLFAYQGEAGTGLMTFRWDLVKRLLKDLADGRREGLD